MATPRPTLLHIRSIHSIQTTSSGNSYLECDTDQGLVAFWGRANDMKNITEVANRVVPFVATCGSVSSNWPRHALWIPQGADVSVEEPRAAAPSFAVNELAGLRGVGEREHLLRQFLATSELVEPIDLMAWFEHLVCVKDILGNVNNSVSLLATLLAKRFLVDRFHLADFDAAAKPQGAAGPDIDVETVNGERIVAEIKTTSPYRVNGFGAAQEREFKKDFAKLNACGAKYRFLFVTDARAFELLRTSYSRDIPGVTVVDLLSGSELTA